MLDAVHDALVASGVPPIDKFHRVLELAAEDFNFDPNYPDLKHDRTDDFVLIEILWSVGRSVKVKKKLLEDLMSSLSRQGLNPENVMVCFKETLGRIGPSAVVGSFTLEHVIKQQGFSDENPSRRRLESRPAPDHRNSTSKARAPARCWWRSRPPASATPTTTRSRAPTRKACSRPILGHEGAGIVVDVGPGRDHAARRATTSSRSTRPNAGSASSACRARPTCAS